MKLAITLQQLFDRYIITPRSRYRLSARLRGHQGGVGCVAFDERCRTLASGGDDEVVKIWNPQTHECLQTLSDQASQWGQITSLAFVPALVGRSTYLLFGTGRGRLVIYQRNPMSPLFIQIFDQPIFTNFDSVESMSFSIAQQRILATSQSGKIKLFRFGGGQVSELWERMMKDAIPRSSLFSGDGLVIQVFGLETGEVTYYDTETAEKKGMQTLKTRIGGASICDQSHNVLVDNLGSGFDLYAPNRSQPVRSYAVPAKRRFVKKAVFGEMGKLVVCGSDHGTVYAYEVNGTSVRQELLHGSGEDRLPVVETGHSTEDHFIATGSRGKRNEICVWKKPITRAATQVSPSVKPATVSFILNMMLVMIFAWYSMDVWMPIVTSHTQAMGTSVAGFIDNVVIAMEQQRSGSDVSGRMDTLDTSRWSDARFYMAHDDDEWDEVDLDRL